MKPNFNKLHNSIPNILPLPIAVILNNTYDTYIYIHTHTQLSYNSVPNILPVSVPTAVFLNLYDVYMHITRTHTQTPMYTYMYVFACCNNPTSTHTHGVTGIPHWAFCPAPEPVQHHVPQSPPAGDGSPATPLPPSCTVVESGHCWPLPPGGALPPVDLPAVMDKQHRGVSWNPDKEDKRGKMAKWLWHWTSDQENCRLESWLWQLQEPSPHIWFSIASQGAGVSV